jgi:hypothetical protein
MGELLSNISLGENVYIKSDLTPSSYIANTNNFAKGGLVVAGGIEYRKYLRR